jgi:hypothetical protein
MTSWRTWSGRWAAVLAGAVLAVAPAAARACDDEDGKDHHKSAEVEGGKLKDEASRQAYVRSVEQMGSEEERSRALLRLMADAPISEATGAAILEVASRMQSDRPLARVLAFFHEIQESDLVRGPLAQKYLDAASRLRDPDVLALDARGTLSYTSCQTIRKLDLASGAITTLYGFPDEVHRALLGCVTNGRPLTAD